MKTAPTPPGHVVLKRVTGGSLPEYRTPDGRFILTRNPAEKGVRFEDSGYDLVDTRQRSVLVGRNVARVYEVEDGRALIARALRIEYLAALQRWEDSKARSVGATP